MATSLLFDEDCTDPINPTLTKEELISRLMLQCQCKTDLQIMEKHVHLLNLHSELLPFYQALIDYDIRLLFTMDDLKSQEIINEILIAFCNKKKHPQEKPRSSVSVDDQYRNFIKRFQYDLKTICIKDSFLINPVNLGEKEGEPIGYDEEMISKLIDNICIGDKEIVKRREDIYKLFTMIKDNAILYLLFISSYLIYYLELLLVRYCNIISNPNMREIHLYVHCLPPQKDLQLIFPLIDMLIPSQRLPLQISQILFVEKTNLLVNLSRVSYLIMKNAVNTRNLIKKRINGKIFQGVLSAPWKPKQTANLIDKIFGFNIERIHFLFKTYELGLYEFMEGEEININESIRTEQPTKVILEEFEEDKEKDPSVIDEKKDDDDNTVDWNNFNDVELINVIGFKYMLGYTEANANALLTDIGQQIQEIIDDWPAEDNEIAISEGDLVGFKSIGKSMDRPTLYLYPTLRGQVLAIVSEIAMLWVVDIGALTYVPIQELYFLTGQLASRPPLVSFFMLKDNVCTFDEVFLHRNLLFIHQILECNIQVGKQFLLNESGPIILNFIEYPSLEIRIEFLSIIFLLTKNCPQVRKFLVADNFENKLLYRLKYLTFAYRNDLVRNRGGMKREIELLSAILLHLIKDTEALDVLPISIVENGPLVFKILLEESKQNDCWLRLNTECINQLNYRLTPNNNTNTKNNRPRREVRQSNWRNDCKDIKRNPDNGTGFFRASSKNNNNNNNNKSSNNNWRDRSKTRSNHFNNRGDTFRNNNNNMRSMSGFFRSLDIKKDLKNNSLENISIDDEKKIQKHENENFGNVQHINFEDKSRLHSLGDGDAPSGIKSEPNVTEHFDWDSLNNDVYPNSSSSNEFEEKIITNSNPDKSPSDLSSEDSLKKLFESEENFQKHSYLREDIKDDINNLIKKISSNDDVQQNLTRLSYKTDFYIYGSKIEERTDEHNELFQIKNISEVKESKLAQIICGFLNSGSGGNVFFGINKDSIIEGLHLKREDKDAFRNGIDRIMNRCLFPEVKPSFYNITFTPVVYSNKKVYDIDKINNFVVKITAFPMLHVVYVVYQGHYCFVREGTMNKQYTAQQRRLLVMKQEEALIIENIRNLKSRINDDLIEIAKFVNEFLPHLNK